MKKLITIFVMLFSFSGIVPAHSVDLPALNPTFGRPIPVIGGFSVQVSNYDGAFAWSVSSSAGSVYIGGSGLIEVNGLTSGQTSVVTVTTSRTGYLPGRGVVLGMAQQELLNVFPILSTMNPERHGFQVQIVNYSTRYIWSAAANFGVASAPSLSGVITITGAPRGQAVTVTVKVDLQGYLGRQSTIIGNTLPPPTGISPLIGAVTTTGNGFTIPVRNFDDWYDWTITASSGQGSIDANGLITVTGNDPAKLVRVGIVAAHNGVQAANVWTIGYSNSSALVMTPEFGTIDDRADGFSVQIENWDPLYTWTIYASGGTAEVDDAGLIDVSGLKPGEKSVVSVSQRVMNGPTSRWTLNGASFPAFGLVPKLGSVNSQGGGFTIQILNYSSQYDYAVSSKSGNAKIGSNGLITVKGLKAGASTNITVSTSRHDNPGRSSTIKGTASLTITSGDTSTPKPTSSATGKPVTVDNPKSSKGIKTIICVKGQTKKFVKGKKPKCPSGYKRK